MPIPDPIPTVTPEVLVTIATACRDHERLRFAYTTHGRSMPSERRSRTDWSTSPGTGAGWTVSSSSRRPASVHAPAAAQGDLTFHVSRGIGPATWRYRARVRVHAPAEELVGRRPPAIPIEPVDEDSCVIDVGSNTPQMLAIHLGMLDADFEGGGPSELLDQLSTAAARYARARRSTGPAGAP